MIIIFLIRLVLIILTIYISVFFLWRTFEREHVDDVPMVLDRVFFASLIAWYLARIPSGIDMVISQTIAPLSLLNPMVGAASWQVAAILFCILFYHSLRENWRDRYAVLDFAVVAIPIFLTGYFSWQVLTLILSTLLTSAQFPVGYFVTTVLGVIYFFGLSRLLVYFERQYRAYFWYRYRRSSAQTGFVTSVFCIGLGLFGILHHIYLLPFTVLSLPMFLTVWSLFTMVGGFILLYIRSGRLKKR